MAQTLFTQNVIAVIWDFDKTLTPSYMQTPLFTRFNVDEKKFWAESNGLAKNYRIRGAHNVSKDTLYLNHILTYVREGIFKDLSNKLLYDLGAEIPFYEGLPDFFERLKNVVQINERFRKQSITVEHYIVSTGLRQMIMGSSIAPFVEDVWGCEFVEGSVQPNYLDTEKPGLFASANTGVISDIAYSIDNTTKSRALFEINKGGNKVPEIDVNASLAPEDRRVPFQNMIYIADGPSDVPAFSIVNHYGGRTLAVYKPKMRDQFVQANRLQTENRVQGIGEASYVEGSLTSLWLENAVEEIATKIVSAREAALRDKVGATPQHILTDIPELASRPAVAEEPVPPVAVPAVAEKKPPVSEVRLLQIDKVAAK
jgi:hypothetical protein